MAHISLFAYSLVRVSPSSGNHRAPHFKLHIRFLHRNGSQLHGRLTKHISEIDPADVVFDEQILELPLRQMQKIGERDVGLHVRSVGVNFRLFRLLDGRIPERVRSGVFNEGGVVVGRERTEAALEQHRVAARVRDHHVLRQCLLIGRRVRAQSAQEAKQGLVEGRNEPVNRLSRGEFLPRRRRGFRLRRLVHYRDYCVGRLTSCKLRYG